MNLLLAVSNFAAHGHKLRNTGRRSKPRDISWVILTVSRFHGFFHGLPLPNNTVQSCSGAKDSHLGRFLFMIITPVINFVKTMSKYRIYSNISRMRVYVAPPFLT